MTQKPEVWLRGTLAGYDPVLVPIAHSLLQVQEDLEALVPRAQALDPWTPVAGAASIGFHVRHIGGSVDRLLTYARGESLSSDQFTALGAERQPHTSFAAAVSETAATLERALEQLRKTDPKTLLVERKVGRAGLPSTTIGLLFHAAEHATRHAGQALTTARIQLGLAS